jgi:myo-inositol-hexaphosphate 3-phosphohydrolase
MPNTNSPCQSEKSNTSLLLSDIDNLTIFYLNNSVKYRIQMQKAGDYCYIYYNRETECMSRKYFENLGEGIMSEIGLNSYEGLYTSLILV